ncbi:MAG TPA: HD domain-containing phosphohydrolase [Thermodesulfobacteriota bacterium]|nr:HD domain-containing phosphohydrolase [Thermodesulfobacteriota bacterium]
MPKRILIVDDEEPNRELLKSILDSLGHDSETAADGFEALAKYKLDIDLVLLDVNMPGMDGFTVVRRIREDPDCSSVPILMVTALTSKNDRLRAVEAGANDFITKPIDVTELKVRMASLLRMKEAQDAIKRHQEELERTVEKRTAYLRQSLDNLAKAHRATYEAHLDTIRCLAVAAEYKDENTGTHINRMSHYTALLAQGLNLPPNEVELILHASKMHDVGKIGIPDSILLKPGKLTEEEMEIMKQHTIIGARILEGSLSEILQAGKVMALSHHEKWDGSGYPKGLSGKDIPLWGRICAVADVFDAITSDRPYHKAMPNEKAYEILREERGRHFDPGIIDVFFDRIEEVLKIQERYRG